MYPMHKFQFTCPSRSTTKLSLLFPVWIQFQFTCPSRSTTHAPFPSSPFGSVSIHVPLAEHDVLTRLSVQVTPFQFTCPSRSTTDRHCRGRRRYHRFNSRAPRGARRRLTLRRGSCGRFNSRAPRGARRDRKREGVREPRFNSRAPRGARRLLRREATAGCRFNSRAPRGARRID